MNPPLAHFIRGISDHFLTELANAAHRQGSAVSPYLDAEVERRSLGADLEPHDVRVSRLLAIRDELAAGVR